MASNVSNSDTMCQDVAVSGVVTEFPPGAEQDENDKSQCRQSGAKVKVPVFLNISSRLVWFICMSVMLKQVFQSSR